MIVPPGSTIGIIGGGQLGRMLALAAAQRALADAGVSSDRFGTGLLDRMLGSGRLVVESAGEHGQIVLTDIPRVEATQGTLYAGADLVRALLASRTPVVALVNGVAAGIGVPMALACDYVLASDAASFVLAFARIGLMPDGGSTALVAASIGRARAMRLALTGEKLDSVRAAEWGMVAGAAIGSGRFTKLYV